MVLSGQTILDRLNKGDIFRQGTWEESCIKEASYALRIVRDGMMIDGDFYNPGKYFKGNFIKIEPGKIAILSTEERLNMPCDLVGKIGIRLDYALRGLTGLMGIQVDPFYGSDKCDERLFIRVANLGNEAISLSTGDAVFTFELHKVAGAVEKKSKGCTWDRIKNELSHQDDSSWSYVTQVKSDLSKETQNVRENQQPVVLFGVFLVAATILSVAISLAVNFNGMASAKVPSWFDDGGWMMLLATFIVGTFATATIGVITALQFFKKTEWNISINCRRCKNERSRSSG